MTRQHLVDCNVFVKYNPESFLPGRFEHGVTLLNLAEL